MNRDDAYQLVCEYTQSDSLRKHMLAVEAASRDDIVRGAEDLGVELNEHIQFVIDAMAGIADQLDRNGDRSTRDP